MNKLDQESMALMANAEKKAKKSNQVAFPFHQKQPYEYVVHRSSDLFFATMKD
jgi:hypothetical protein